MATRPENRPSTTTLDNGRIVTLSVKWWYDNKGFLYRDTLHCIHGKTLLTSCNDCVDQKGYKDDA